jgi:hypothetical protein
MNGGPPHSRVSVHPSVYPERSGALSGYTRGVDRAKLTDVAFRAWNLPLAAARQSAKELRAKIALGHDVAGENQERKSTALARIGALPNVRLTARCSKPYGRQRRRRPNGRHCGV